LATGFLIYEAEEQPGGICSSYYIRPGSSDRLAHLPKDGETYRFESGGGHWIFGGDDIVLKFLEKLTPVKQYVRKSSVYFCTKNLYVPYPIQNNLRFLDQTTRERVLNEIFYGNLRFKTMKEWLHASFGQTLSELFFYPFHQLYTANLYECIAPQDAQKSPINVATVIQGSQAEVPAAGYNVTFVYPEKGLDVLTRKMAEQCDIRYGKRVVKIDVHKKEAFFSDGDTAKYEKLISTLPLNRMMELTGLAAGEESFPYTSVLVLNIGAVRGGKCPDDHWLYNPDAKAGFHRVGFYSNVDSSFLPKSSRNTNDRVGIYVERSFVGGEKPSEEEVADYSKSVIRELQDLEFIGEAEVVDPTWIDVAYTWSWPGSHWKESALKKLQEHDIHSIGRYGHWTFQGIADSIQEGLGINVLL